MFSAALEIGYDAFDINAGGSCATLAMLPAVLETCRIFFVGAFSRNGRTTWESSAGPAAFVRTTFSNASGSSVNAVSKIACIACGQPQHM